MKILLHYFLLLGVILGLAGQAVASAVNPCAMMAMAPVKADQSSVAKPMADMSGCTMSDAEMKIAKADTHHADKGTTPCKAMGLCCLALAGGGALAASNTAPNLDRLPVKAAIARPWLADSFPLDWNILPELDPPSNLG